MIISKKKFEKLVDEEVFKRIDAVEKRRREEERYSKLVEDLDRTNVKLYALRDEVVKLVDCLLQSKGVHR